MFLHRCVPGFVLQGGGYITLNRLDTNLFTHTAVYNWPNFGTITNEFNVGRRFSNSYGTIAMARSPGQTNSATSQWFFNLVDNPALDNVDGGFTVFGRVVRGTNILSFFNALSYNNGIINMTNYSSHPLMASLFTQLPVTYLGAVHPRISDLLYVDISLLNVRINQTNQTQEILWNSVAGRTNYVEFTTNFPPVWHTLIKTNGTGSTLRVTDASTGSIRRFYRVRIDY
jgi:cyclophilin family peptidyl-prolyl cis-trans isomerase